MFIFNTAQKNWTKTEHLVYKKWTIFGKVYNLYIIILNISSLFLGFRSKGSAQLSICQIKWNFDIKRIAKHVGRGLCWISPRWHLGLFILNPARVLEVNVKVFYFWWCRLVHFILSRRDTGVVAKKRVCNLFPHRDKGFVLVKKCG